MRNRSYLCCAGRFGLLPLICLSLRAAHAGSATWNLNPTTGNWNTATNWTPNTVPNGPSDIASFSTSTGTAISFSNTIEVDSIVFNAGASIYTITNTPFHPVTISGGGVFNNSGQTQQIVADMGSGSPNEPQSVESPAFPSIVFTNSASAGSNIIYSSIGGTGTTGVGGNFIFNNSSSADHAVFNVEGTGALEFYPTEITFNDSSTAANSTINLTGLGNLNIGALIPNLPTLANASINNTGGQMSLSSQATCGEAIIINSRARSQLLNSLTIGSQSAPGNSSAGGANITNQGANATAKEGNTVFRSTGTAEQAVIINNGGQGAGNAGGSVTFGPLTGDTPTADGATLIANAGTNGGNGGLISFAQNSLGGTARCEVFGNGTLDISPHFAPGVTIGSVEGDGLVFLGAQNLTLGSNNLSTVFSGVIQDGGSAGGTGGSLTKTGTGKLTLTSANTYTGGTVINGGTLLVNNSAGSGLGKGAVQAMAGTLGGSGIIAGAVAVGTGGGPGAVLAPGQNSVLPGALIIGKQLTLKADATYRFTYNSNTLAVDEIIAKGAKIRGAQIVFNDGGNASLLPGTVFVVIRNTSANPISGTFSNLADGSTIVVGSNTFQTSYTGGDGNDLTLTVVP